MFTLIWSNKALDDLADGPGGKPPDPRIQLG